LYNLFRTVRPKNHTLSIGTSPYSPGACNCPKQIYMHVLITALRKSNANVFRQNSRLFLAFRRKNIEFSMEANFQRKVTMICGAYCSLLCEFSNDNSFGTKSDFEFSSEKALCSINDFEHMREILLFISSAQTFPSILWTVICQVRSCRDDSFVLSSP